eukprot:m.65678 g.65678  ORF g.65678 m.65678 type:complete len:59 (+) comp23587_c0_seq3:322-498(+)
MTPTNVILQKPQLYSTIFNWHYTRYTFTPSTTHKTASPLQILTLQKKQVLRLCSVMIR